MDEKAGFEHVDTTRHDSLKYDAAAKHGDRALAYLGDERVIVTEADVRPEGSWSSSIRRLTCSLEQAHTAQD